MTVAEIKRDPWAARDDAARKLRDAADRIEALYISEDGMIEDAEYRKEIVSQIKKAHKVANIANKEV